MHIMADQGCKAGERLTLTRRVIEAIKVKLVITYHRPGLERVLGCTWFFQFGHKGKT